MSRSLSLSAQSLLSRLVLQASAGTGKTYSITGLVVRELGTQQDLRIGEILITSFTRNSAADLEKAIRERLLDTLELLRNPVASSTDPIVATLRFDQEKAIRLLERAVQEFDTASISTINQLAIRVLAMAGISAKDETDDRAEEVVHRAANDLIVEFRRRDLGVPGISEDRLCKMVRTFLANPDAKLWPGDSPTRETARLCRQVSRELVRTVNSIRARNRFSPPLSDQIRLACEILSDPAQPWIAEDFRRRFKIGFVDEAQDTDDLQWAMFNRIIPDGTGHTGRLTIVGDPKQAIYGFRGADVGAYLRATRGKSSVSLGENFRSDKPVVDALNAMFEGSSLGAGINYSKVTAAAVNHVTRVRHVAPVELIDVGRMTNQDKLPRVVVAMVARILSTAEVWDEDCASNDKWRKVRPSDICVLTRTGAVGLGVQSRLARIGIPAVVMGTHSVARGEMFAHIRTLVEALVAPRNQSRLLRLAGSGLFPYSLVDGSATDENNQQIVQELLLQWGTVLRTRGVAALFSSIIETDLVLSTVAQGAYGERRMTDLEHLVDELYSMTNGRGVAPEELHACLMDLSNMDELSEKVQLRAENDSDAVRVMTIHAAKGLQFPFVVVADLWKAETTVRTSRSAPAFRRTASGKRLQPLLVDFEWLLQGSPANETALAIIGAQNDERRRLLYVALTRPQHHLSLVHTSDTPLYEDELGPDDSRARSSASQFKPSILNLTLNIDRALQKVPGVARIAASQLPTPAQLVSASASAPLQVRLDPAEVLQNHRRLSFTGISSRLAGWEEGDEREQLDNFPETVDEEDYSFAFDDKQSFAQEGLEDEEQFPLARIPAGAAVGTALHSVYEHLRLDSVQQGDHAALTSEVAAVVNAFLGSSFLAGHISTIVEGVAQSVRTPLGGIFGDKSLVSFGDSNRLNELRFEMLISDRQSKNTVSSIGRLLAQHLEDDDVLADYARAISGTDFNVSVDGLLNGSLDALLRVENEHGGSNLIVVDYKSNRLDREDDRRFADAYSRERMLAEMCHHHYPLQALIYGTAVHRYLRWRNPTGSSMDRVVGFAYLFVRGMAPNLVEADDWGNHSHGVFTWRAPEGLWDALSTLLSRGRT